MESVEPPVGGAASTSGGNEAAPPDSLPPLPPPPSWLEDTENETGNECESLDLTSFPNLFYLSPDDLSCSPSVENVQFVSGDNYRIGSHQALLGASCQTLKSCLLDPAVIVASEEVLILCPDYSKQDVDTFLEVLFGLKPDKEVSDDVRALLEDSGFYKKPEPYRPPTQPKPKRVNTSSDGGLAKKSREAAERRRRRRLKPLFQCRKCRECYKYRASFKRHSKKVHGMNDSDSDYDLRNVGLSNKPLFRCRKCNECYKYRAAFKKHSKKLHGMNSSDSDYELENVVESTKRPKLYEFDKSGEEMLPCHLCSESVPRKFLVEHLHAFHQIPPCYKCELCSEELKTQQDYRHHLRNEHGRELYPEREKCDYCPKNIRVHERELHLRVCKKAPHHIKVQYQSRNPKRLINSDDDSDSEDDTDSSDEWDTRQIKPKKQVDRPREHSLPGGVKTERDMKPDTKPGGHSIFDCKVKIEVLGEEGESFNDHPDRHRKHQHPDVKTESAYDSDGRAEQGPSDMKMKKKQWKAYKNPASNMDSDSNFNDVPTINDSDFDSKSMIGEDGFKAKNKSSSGKKRPNDSALGDGKSKPSAKKKKYRKRGDKKEKKEKRPPPPCKPELDAATGKYFCPFEGGCDFKADKERSVKVHIDCVHRDGGRSTKTMLCEHCSETFPTKTLYTRHLRMVHKERVPRVVCFKCGKSVSQERLTYHDKICDGTLKLRIGRDFVFTPHPEDPRKCPYPMCEFTHDKIHRLKRHYGSSHATLHCPHCEKDINITHYDKHLSVMHNIQNRRNTLIKCTDCDKTFTSGYDQRTHMDEVHIREPKYVCEICSHACISKRRLTVHRYESHIRKFHSFKCEMCGASFRGVKPLKAHMLVVHLTKLEKTTKEMISGISGL